MSENLKCDHTPNLVARHEAALATLTVTLNDFIARSTEDRRECAIRYSADRIESREFRTLVLVRLETVENFISGLKPDHKMLMLLALGIVTGALSLIWRMIWHHIGKT